MSWIEKIKTKNLLKSKGLKDAPIWIKCKGCSTEIYIAELEKIYAFALNVIII